MRAIKCEICGGTDIIKQDGLFVCRYCGAKYSPEEVRKLAGTVRIDRTGETENCMTLARRFLHENNYPKAEEYFELVLRNDPNNLEAVYFLPFCTAMKSNLMMLEYAAAGFRQSLNTVFTAIGETDGEERIRRTYTELVFSNTLYFCSHQYHSAANAYPAIAKDPSMTVCFRAVNRGMQEIASIYAFLETTLRDRYPEDRELRGKVQKDELAFYDAVGKYIMKPIQLMKEKKRLKREMK